jgi:AraC-like DNA-binding protein
MTTPLQRSRFSTESLPPEQRESAWRESIGTVFDISTDHLKPADQFNATVTSYLINQQLMLSRCDTKAQRFERGALKGVRDGLDYYLLQTHLTGSQVMRNGQREVECHAGDLMVIDLAEAHDAVTTDFSQLTLVVPRQLLAPHLLNPDSQEGRVLRCDKGLTQLAVNHLKNLYASLGNFTESEARLIVEPTLLLLASTLNGSCDTVENGAQGVNVGMLTAAKAMIEQNLERELSVDNLCGLLKMSRSTLYRLFEPLGGVRAYIQERRLRRSATMLLSDRDSRLRICDIAWCWGFASEAHFSRAFRLRYGLSPREARLGLGSLSRSTGRETGDSVSDRDYEKWLEQILRNT